VPSLFIYKAFTRCEGFFIRKKTWRLIIDDYMHVSNELRSKIVKNYTKFEKKIMNIAKKKDLEKSRLTNKVENIKMVIRFDENLKNVNPA